MSILNVPIQINGGPQPTRKLLDRELFISDSGYLLYGSDSSNSNAVNVKVAHADTTPRVNSYGSGIDINSYNNNATFGNFKFYVSGRLDSNNVPLWDLYGDSWKAHLYQTTINDCRFSKIVLNGDCYGSDPDNVGNPTDGQIFFKVQL